METPGFEYGKNSGQSQFSCTYCILLGKSRWLVSQPPVFLFPLTLMRRKISEQSCGSAGRTRKQFVQPLSDIVRADNSSGLDCFPHRNLGAAAGPLLGVLHSPSQRANVSRSTGKEERVYFHSHSVVFPSFTCSCCHLLANSYPVLLHQWGGQASKLSSDDESQWGQHHNSLPSLF